MNWGTKIAIAFSFFVVFIGYLVYRTTQVNIDLVSDNYYQLELEFQDQLDKQERLRALEGAVLVSQHPETIELTLPPTLAGQKHAGTVLFMRPQAERFDRAFAMTPNEQGVLAIPKADLLPGRYVVKADWSSNGTSYYYEKALFIQ